ncbi:MAG: hypothetical protein JWN70_6547 [Planctomycetaceae bacterium]|nr:hypothetical protein [Planctomycetaceae bacterium]
MKQWHEPCPNFTQGYLAPNNSLYVVQKRGNHTRKGGGGALDSFHLLRNPQQQPHEIIRTQTIQRDLRGTQRW